MNNINYSDDEQFALSDDDFVILDEEYIEFQRDIYDDVYISDTKVGDWVYDDGELLAGMTCVYHWYATSEGDQQEKYRQIYERLKTLNKRD